MKFQFHCTLTLNKGAVKKPTATKKSFFFVAVGAIFFTAPLPEPKTPKTEDEHFSSSCQLGLSQSYFSTGPVEVLEKEGVLVVNVSLSFSVRPSSKQNKNFEKISSPAGNRTRVFRVTGGDTDHYTTEEFTL